MNISKKYSGIAMLFAALALGACESDQDTIGTISLQLTDAPIDVDNISGVYITFSGVSYKRGDAWFELENFEEPRTVNLLELTNGESLLLGDFEVEAGEYSEIRFDIENDKGNGGTGQNEGTYVAFTDGHTEPLLSPSGASSGYKGKGTFVVPVNEVVSVTADFDVRKSVVQTGSGKYLLKPVIRLVVNDQAGSLEGSLANTEEGASYVVYAYEDGTYTEAEIAEPAEGESRFANAVSSDLVEEGKYVISFLAPGTYDLYVVANKEGEAPQVVSILEDVTVSSAQVSTQDITIE